MIAQTLPQSESNRPRPELTNSEARKYEARIQRHANRVARRLPRHVRVGDLVSAGYYGLVDAFLKYDTARLDSFEAYVDHRIRGAIMDELRSFDPLTRDQRSFARKLSAARQSAANETGYPPTEHDVAKVLGMPLPAFRANLERMSTMAARNEATLYDDETSDVAEPQYDQPDSLAERNELLAHIASGIETLPKRMQQVVWMHFFEGKTMREVGDVLGVTESRVSQLITEALGRLRTVIRHD